MNKDPAFLFYSSDFLVGTMLMTNEQVGKYIRLMCYAHQKGGYITEQDILNICGGVRDEELFNKFTFDGDGVYYNERLLSEIRKRSNYTESRRNNRMKATPDDLFIYLIKNKSNGLVKIGSSNNPERRLIELKNQEKGSDLEIIATIGGVSQRLETKLQKEYKHKNSYNEWFELNEEDIEEIIKSNDMINHMIAHIKNHMSNHMENENISLNSSSISLKNNKDEIVYPYQEIIEYLNQKAKKKFRVVDKTRKLIQARFNEKFTLDDFKKVIDNQTVKWLNDLKMADYLRPETLFGTKFEGYLNSNGVAPKQNGRVENVTEYPTIEADDVDEEALKNAFEGLK